MGKAITPVKQAHLILGCTPRLATLWNVMHGRNAWVTVGRLKSEQVDYNFGKNVRQDLAVMGIDPSKLTGEELEAFKQKCDLAIHLSAKRGHNFIHRSGFVIVFKGARGAKVADEANEVAKGRSKRARARKILASA